ncbi:COX15/CtaA family protein [Dokdonia sp.]|uniref:COX15/CtaA family protein n=1 Tax=Dokdonia sp. TaxID=2024995 RepID=UPI00326720DF
MYRTTLKISIIFLYLIIIAGAVVRMTGSGMGCPDWPKCFGYYIPPTQEAQIQWESNKEYKEGHIIIVDESLRIAPKDFTSGTAYTESNWSTYDKHDYAKFNVWQTWIEYINRQVTVLAGIPILLMIISAFWYWRRRPWLIFGSFFVLPLMGFEAWLGKQVVDSNLLPVKITIHLIAALFIVALLLYLWYTSQVKERSMFANLPAGRQEQKKYDPLFKNLILFAGVLTLVQVAFGTQVRQHVDEQVMALGYDAKDQWLNPPTFLFYVHRSFSILVTLLNVYLFWRNRKYLLGHANLLLWVLILIALEVVTGIAMYYIDFPFGTQPLHLVVASLLFGVQFYVYLESFKDKKEVIAV